MTSPKNRVEHPQGERAILVALSLVSYKKIKTSLSSMSVRESLNELQLLAESAGAMVIDKISQEKPKANPATLVGKGFVENLGLKVKEQAIDVVIFDNELSPTQNRNLETALNCKVLDRTSLILDIFASRAKTREGKIQVELAQLQYLYPRLVGLWMHFSRQEGGIGMRGPGETQLEVDRRIVKDRMQMLTQKLEKVKKGRALRRGKREQGTLPVVSLIGYTNVGKSSLLNKLGGMNANSQGKEIHEYADDRHFATLDPVTRRIGLNHHLTVLVNDTVGFVQKLPHQLVASFRSTFEEINHSDLLIHVVDQSHPQCELQLEEVHRVLHEIGAEHIPLLTFYNKVDLCPGWSASKTLNNGIYHGSARTGLGLEPLVQAMVDSLEAIWPRVHLQIPMSEGKVRAHIFRQGAIISEEADGNFLQIEARLPYHLQQKLKSYIVSQ